MADNQEFRGMTGAIKGKGVKPAPEDKGQIKWTKDRLAWITNKIAPSVYRKYSWNALKYSVDDFTQDALMHIMELYDRNYLDLTLNNIGPLIKRMLNGHFVYNMYKKHKKFSKELSLNNTEDTEYNSIEYIANVKDESPTSDTLLLGEDFLKSFIDNLSFHAYRTRKHSYVGHTKKSGKIELTEANLAKLIISGYSLHDILKVFNVDVDNIGSSSQASYISHRVKAIIDKLALVINNEEDDVVDAIKAYIDTAKLLEDLI